MRLILVFVTIVTLGASHKILIYNSKAFQSHTNFMGKVADILVEAGHDVTTLMPEIDVNLGDSTKFSKIIRVPTSEAVMPLMAAQIENPVNFFTTPPNHPTFAIQVGNMVAGLYSTQCNATLEHPGLIDQLTEEQFDVMLTENFDYCGTGLSHLIRPKALIIVSTAVIFESIARDIGTPFPGSYAPGLFTEHIDGHSLWSRAKNAYNIFMNSLFHSNMETTCEAVFRRKFGWHFPTMRQLTSRASFVFVNSEPILDFAVPTLTKVVHLGGITAEKTHPLADEWENMLDERNRTILISFGTVAQTVTMPLEYKRAMLKAISFFRNVTFLWKYENPEDAFSLREASVVDNLKLSKWFPQNDLLADPRVHGMISHSGAGTVMEAATLGKPLILVPLFADQPRNAAAMANTGSAIMVNKNFLDDEEKLRGAIAALLKDRSLQENALRISDMLRRRPFSPRELMLKYVDFAAQFGYISSLTPKSIELNVVELYNLDLIATAVLSIVVFAYVAFTILRRLAQYLTATKKDKLA